MRKGRKEIILQTVLNMSSTSVFMFNQRNQIPSRVNGSRWPSSSGRDFIFMNKWEISPFGPTRKSGVYCVMSTDTIAKKTSILYIGSAKNIYRRVMNKSHIYRRLYEISSYPLLVYLKIKECDDYVSLEKRMIKRIRPKYNIQHTGISIYAK